MGGQFVTNAVTLSSLAMLKVSIDTGSDYLEYLRPYVLHILSKTPPDIVSDTSVSAKIKQICGLEIPHRTVHIVLQRLAKAGYLKKESGVYVIAAKLPHDDVAALRAEADRHISSVVERLIFFAKEQNDKTINESDATDCLVAFLAQFSIPCLKSYLRGTALPDASNHSDWQIKLVSHFINNIAATPTLFESFMQLVHGHMIANALLCPDLHSVSKTYKDVVFYFDTPLLIELLGLEGDQEQQAIKEVIALVKHLQGRVLCFSHTLDELINAIRNAADHVDSSHSYGTIIIEARRAGRTKSDLLLIAENAVELLKQEGVTTTQTPVYDQKNYKYEIDELVFSSVLDEEVNYQNPRARDYDVKSVRSIYVLREGIMPYSIEKSRAVLVTSNTAFSKAAYEYGKRYEQSREVSAVITDFSLANTAWLKAPQGAPSLPKKEIIAFAYAALRPTSAFWEKVLAEAEKLETKGEISARDHQLLRSSHHLQSELMALTLGEEAALSGQSISKTIDRISSEIKKEESTKYVESQRTLRERERELEQKNKALDDIRKQVYWRIEKRSKVEAHALSALIWAVQIAIAVIGVVEKLRGSDLGWLVIGGAALSGIVRVVGVHFDTKAFNVRDKYFSWRLPKLLKREYAALNIANS
ncbi:MAG: hypothetical protein ABUL58_00880 [Steroidobacter sp.]